MLRRLGVILSTCAILVLAGGFALAATRGSPPSAMALDTALVFDDHGVDLLSISAVAGDSLTVVARWGAASNGGGAADSYRVRWVLTNEQSAERVVTLLEDRFTFALPPVPDSVGVRVIVWAIRRNLQSLDSVRSTRYFKGNTVDQPPPPPGPVIIDTVAVHADSVALFFSKANLAFNSGAGFIPGSDTTLACAAARVRGTNQWYIGEYAVVAQGVGKDSLAASGVIHMPLSRCSKLIASKGGPAVDTSAVFPLSWNVGISPQFGATKEAKQLPARLFANTT